MASTKLFVRMGMLNHCNLIYVIYMAIYNKYSNVVQMLLKPTSLTPSEACALF
jgi:hypothetical protein